MYRRPKLHKISYKLTDHRHPEKDAEYSTINGTFTLQCPTVTMDFPDGQELVYDPLVNVQVRYEGYTQPGKLRLRERLADAWDAFRGRTLPYLEEPYPLSETGIYMENMKAALYNNDPFPNRYYEEDDDGTDAGEGS